MNNSLIKLRPSIYPLVNELVCNGRIGICAGNVRLIDFRSGVETTNEPSIDRFKLVIPYAGQSVTWEMVFYGNSSRFPPDFLFDDKSFHPDINSIEALGSWKGDELESLLKLVQELMEAYRKHQVSQIEQHDRLYFEYTSLVEQTDFNELDVEVQVHKKLQNGPVNFLIKLPIDFSSIPPTLAKDQGGEESAVLLITFQSTDGIKIIPQLFLSPRIEEAMGGCSLLKIPSFPSGGCLMDYVPNVRKLLINKIDQLVSGFEMRKEYFSAFKKQFSGSILEYDETNFTKLSFLMEWKDFYFILQIDIPKFFPQDNPIFKLQSIYHWQNGRPFVTTHKDYPYSPRWTGEEMAARAKTFLNTCVPTFQKNSVKGSTRSMN